MDCLFCRMAQGEIPTDKVYEDEEMLIFRDISPQAPLHLLAVPKKHISSASQIQPEDAALVGRIFVQIPQVLESCDLEQGYRVVTNVGSYGGQSIGHLHFHILGGRPMEWPPG